LFWGAEAILAKTAKVFRNKGSQLVRLPREFQFDEGEVFLERRGNAVVLSARRMDWGMWVGAEVTASRYFLPGVGFPSFDERES
jgi:virulence-associated protein VagC